MRAVRISWQGVLGRMSPGTDHEHCAMFHGCLYGARMLVPKGVSGVRTAATQDSAITSPAQQEPASRVLGF